MKPFAWISLGLSLVSAPFSALAAPCQGFDREIERLADATGAREGSVIADIGAGSGAQAIALAGRVGGGRVYATEIDSRERAKIAVAARKAGRTNVVVIEAGETRTGLPEVCCDAIYMRGAYHHITQPAPFLASVWQSLRPRGVFVVIDFPPTLLLWPWKPKGIPANRGGHGIPPEILEQELRTAGFERTRFVEHWSGFWPVRQYAIIVRKPAS